MVTVAQAILDDVVTTLETHLSGSGEYMTELSRVYVMDASEISGLELPAVLVLSDSDRVVEDRVGMRVRRLELVLVLVLRGGEAGWDQRLRDFTADVERALAVDHTRNGNALDTVFEESVVFEGASEAPVAQAEAKVTVQYRTAYGDPHTPM